MQAYDIIGDIHGHADELHALLDILGYGNGTASHAEGRKVIFLGDFIDRGPKIREALETVRGMVETGNAAPDARTIYDWICAIRRAKLPDPAVIGKVGTDIQDNKCSWLINQALKKVSPEQRKLLEDNYGQKDSQKEAKVKELYHELKLQEFYEQWEEERVTDLRAKIEKVDESEGLKKEVFEAFLKKIYKRSK